MFRRIRSSFAWVRMLSRFRKGDIRGAAEEAARFRATGLTRPMFEALDATIDLLSHRPGEAKAKFESVLISLTNKSESRDRYIYLYSLYYSRLLSGKSDADEARKEAWLLATPKLIRILPLPPEPVE